MSVDLNNLSIKELKKMNNTNSRKSLYNTNNIRKTKADLI